jgi:Protein of unknown function (DUF2795)
MSVKRPPVDWLTHDPPLLLGIPLRMGLQASDVRRALRGADYPADREDLAELAESNDADEVAEALREVDEAEFDGLDDVMAALEDWLGDEDD